MIAMTAPAPWRDNARRFSPLKATTLGLMFVPGAWMLAMCAGGGFGRTLWASLIYYTGIWAIWGLLACLAITPLSRVLRSPRLVQLRRMLGLGALAYTLLHVLAYFALREFDFPVMLQELLRRGSIEIATLSTLGLCAMGATSTDSAVRRMGAQRWKRLQRTVYVLAPLGLLHFLLSPLAVGPLPFAMAGMMFWLLGWRVAVRFAPVTRPWPLFMLAIASTSFACLFELLWLDYYQRLSPLLIARANFELDLGLSATWTVLIAAVILVALAAWRSNPPAHRATQEL
jgi:sulfoxide reductase heme-binding subunit YedZ